MKLKILNIHGYGGRPQNAACIALQENGCTDIVSPSIDYDAAAPDVILGRLRKTVEEEGIELIVGTSIGGFFAAVLSAEYDLPVILVSPFLPQIMSVTEYTKPYITFFNTLSRTNVVNVSCIAGDDDESLSDHQLARELFFNERYKSIPGGKHSGFTLPLKEYFGEVLSYYAELLLSDK